MPRKGVKMNRKQQIFLEQMRAAALVAKQKEEENRAQIAANKFQVGDVVMVLGGREDWLGVVHHPQPYGKGFFIKPLTLKGFRAYYEPEIIRLATEEEKAEVKFDLEKRRQEKLSRP